MSCEMHSSGKNVSIILGDRAEGLDLRVEIQRSELLNLLEQLDEASHPHLKYFAGQYSDGCERDLIDISGDRRSELVSDLGRVTIAIVN